MRNTLKDLLPNQAIIHYYKKIIWLVKATILSKKMLLFVSKKIIFRRIEQHSL